MRILITNDDGIFAPGIIKLAEVAAKFGEVVVAAPDGQCSAMSHRISIYTKVKVREIFDYPACAGRAYAIGGTPADCVKIAVEYLLGEKPDIVLSGINNGCNAGKDIAYSGTVAAAMEAVMKGIPAIAVSLAFEGDEKILDEKLYYLLDELLKRPVPKGNIWNVNFPKCRALECKGVLWDRTVAKEDFYSDNYELIEEEDQVKTVMLKGVRKEYFEEGTDLQALVNKYISVGLIPNVIMSR